MIGVYAALAVGLLTPAAPAPDETAPVNVKECVARGLKWLAEQQKEEGNWVGRADSAPTLTTATAGLALLMQGSTLKHGPYAPNLRKAVAWVEKGAQTTGLLVAPNRTEGTRPLAAHASALLFLACAYDVDDDMDRRIRLLRVIANAVDYAGATQSARGGWPLSPNTGRLPDDTLTTIQMLQALVAVQKTGILVQRDTVRKATEYLAKVTAASGDLRPRDDGGGAGGTGQPQLTAGASAALLLHDAPRPDVLRTWLDALRFRTIPEWPTATAVSNTLTTHFHLARTVYALGETGHRQIDRGLNDSAALRWSAYRAKVFRSIKDTQSADGSWPNTVPGPVHGSSIALIILQMENDFLPAFSR